MSKSRRGAGSFHFNSRKQYAFAMHGEWAAKLRIRYQPRLSSKETEPILHIWTSLGKAPREWFQMHPLTGKDISVVVPEMGEGHRWRPGTAVHFQVFSLIDNSEGTPEREKTGSGEVLLSKILAKKEVTVDLGLQSMRTENSGPISKGTLTVTGEVNPRAGFRRPTKYDMVPANQDHLQSWMLFQIRQNEVAFSGEALKKLKIQFDPTFEETRYIHAPYYQTSVGMFPGCMYFASLGTDTDAQIGDDFYRRILGIAANRNDWTLERLTKAIEAQEADRTGKRASDEYREAVVIVADSFNLMSTSLVYIGDFAYAPDGNGSYAEVTVEDFADGQLKHAGDCEDDAKLIARVYRGLRDGRFSDRHVLAAQKVARRLVACATLGSVTSRNIAEAAGGKSRIGDNRDRNMQGVGAHMWVTLLPRPYYHAMLSRTSPSGGIPTPHDFREWERSMETLVCEGTGPLRSQLKAEEARFESRAAKERAVLGEVKLRLAIKRMVAPAGDQASECFHGAMTVRRQEALRGDPEQRLTTFYRVATALYPIPAREEDDPIFLSEDLLDEEDGPARKLYGTRMLIPVQLGGRHGDDPSRMTWGVNLTDLVYQREFVGALRTVRPRNRELNVMKAMAKHLPPYAPIRYSAASPRDLGIVDSWNRELRAAKIQSAEGLWRAEGTTLAVVFWRWEDLGNEEDAKAGRSQGLEIARELANNSWIEAADFVYEPLVHGMSMVRLQARVRTDDAQGRGE